MTREGLVQVPSGSWKWQRRYVLRTYKPRWSERLKKLYWASVESTHYRSLPQWRRAGVTDAAPVRHGQELSIAEAAEWRLERLAKQHAGEAWYPAE